MAADWYYTTHRQQMGPVSWDELQELARRGLVRPQDLVWTDGMEEWIKASRQEGLFESSAAPPAEAKAPPRGGDDAEQAEEQVRSRRARRYDEDDEEEEGDLRRRRRRIRQKEGMAVGLKIGLAIAGGVFLLLILVCGGIFVIVNLGAGDGGPVSYSCNVGPKRKHDRGVYLKKGRQVEVTVTSTSPVPNNDVDLHVLLNNNVIAMDESVGANSRIVFTPPQDATYTMEVRNVGTAAASCRVHVQPR